MNIAYSSKRFGGFLLAFFLLFGIITVASSTAQAQVPWWDRDRRESRREDRFERRQGLQVARQQGYGYGLSVGARDAQRGQSYSPQRSRYWRNANQGYDNDFGNRGQYRQVFRNAFEQGYREGYQRYAYNRRYNRWPR
jgi:hypothetical protein